jgi:hypothetical protein
LWAIIIRRFCDSKLMFIGVPHLIFFHWTLLPEASGFYKIQKNPKSFYGECDCVCSFPLLPFIMFWAVNNLRRKDDLVGVLCVLIFKAVLCQLIHLLY